MIFPGLTVFQNILFVMACLGIILIIAYAILVFVGHHKRKKIVNTDDIDDNTEEFESVGFLFNAFTIRGSLFCFTFACACTFMLSVFWPVWLAILIGVLIGAIVAIIIALVERRPLGEIGELGIVSVKIPAEKEGMGKVILLEDNSEINAETLGKAIKKGKKVIIIENLVNKVLVKKYKKGNNGTRKI